MSSDASAEDAGLLVYLAKLERRHTLQPESRAALLGLPTEAKCFAPGDTVISGEQPANHCVLLQSGVLTRQKTMGDGTCQILAVHVPGDAVDLQSIFFVDADHDIKSHGPSRTTWLPYEAILRACEAHPDLARALWLDTLVDASIFREWTANIGQRNAQCRIAHLVLELNARFEAIGESRNDQFDLPLTQQDLANALGLSLVHLNKSLKALREAGLLEIRGRNVKLLSKQKVMAFASFDPEYLHLGGDHINQRRSTGLELPFRGEVSPPVFAKPQL